MLPIYILSIVPISIYLLIRPFHSLFESRFKIYPWLLLLGLGFLISDGRLMVLFLIFITVIFLVEIEILYFVVSAVQKTFKLSIFKIHFLTYLSLIFSFLVLHMGDFVWINIMLLLPFSFSYALVIIFLNEHMKIKILTLLFLGMFLGLIFILISDSSSMWINAIRGGTLGILPILTYYMLVPIPFLSQNKMKYSMKVLMYIILMEILTQVFLLSSAHFAYTQALKQEVKNIEQKDMWDFYSPTLKEICIDKDTRWSYHRFKYVNVWK